MPWPNNEAHNSPLKCWTRNEHYRTPCTACQPAEMAAAVGVQTKDGLLVVHQLNYLTLRDLRTFLLEKKEVSGLISGKMVLQLSIKLSRHSCRLFLYMLHYLQYQ